MEDTQLNEISLKKIQSLIKLINRNDTPISSLDKTQENSTSITLQNSENNSNQGSEANDESKSSSQSETKSHSKLDLQLTFHESRKDIQVLKQSILISAKKNYVLQRGLEEIAMKIVLVIRNHRKTKKDLERKSKSTPSKNQNKKSSVLTEDQKALYSKILYIFKNYPYFLSDLIPRVTNHKDIDYLLQTIIFSLFADQFDEQEENVLLNLFEKILKREYWRTPHIGSFMRSNTVFTKMIGAVTQRQVYRKFLIDVLKDPISFILKDDNLNLELNPSTIFNELRKKIIESEISEGRSVDSIPNYLDQKEAMKFTLVENEMKERFQKLISVSESVLSSIFHHASSAPFGVKYLCKKIYEYGVQEYIEHSKQASHEDILSLVGGFVFLRYLNPPIATYNLETLGLKDVYPDGLNQRQKTNLKYVAKIIQNLSNGVLFGQKETYLQPMNTFLTDLRPKIIGYFQELCKVGTLSDRLELVKYRQLVNEENNVLVTFNELAFVHKMCLQYINKFQVDENIVSEMTEEQKSTYERTLSDFKEVKNILHSFNNIEAPEPVEDDDESFTIVLIDPNSSGNSEDSELVNTNEAVKELNQIESLLHAILLISENQLENSLQNILESSSQLQASNQENSNFTEIISEALKAYKSIASQLIDSNEVNKLNENQNIQNTESSTDNSKLESSHTQNINVEEMILSKLYYHVINIIDQIEFSKEMINQLKCYLSDIENKMVSLQKETEIFGKYLENVLHSTYDSQSDRNKGFSSNKFTISELIKQKIITDTTIDPKHLSSTIIEIENIGYGRFILKSLLQTELRSEPEILNIESCMDNLLQMHEKENFSWYVPEETNDLRFDLNHFIPFLNDLLIKKGKDKVRIKKPKKSSQDKQKFIGFSWKSL